MLRRSRFSKFGVRQDAKGRAERTHEGVLFGSKLELKRFLQLRMLQRAGEISGLQTQVRYPLLAHNSKCQTFVIVGTYIADFVYREKDALRVEDVKGVLTPIYRFKKKMMKACYGIDIQEWPPKAKKVRKPKRDKS